MELHSVSLSMIAGMPACTHASMLGMAWHGVARHGTAWTYVRLYLCMYGCMLF